MKKQIIRTIFVIIFLLMSSPIAHAFAAQNDGKTQVNVVVPSMKTTLTEKIVNYYPDESLPHDETQLLSQVALAFFIFGLGFYKIPDFVKRNQERKAQKRLGIPFTIPYLGSNQQTLGY